MADSLDPQVSSAIISTSGGLATGIIATLATVWAKWRRRSGQDQRCERICAEMVSMSETMLAVMEAIGADDPRLAPHIAQMEIRIAAAKAFLAEAVPA